MSDQSYKQFIYGLCDPGSMDVRYVGRTNDAADRRRQHVQLSHGDFSPKGIWVKYLELEGLWPDQIILDERSFANPQEGERWAKENERKWIRRLFAEGKYIFNSGCWWHHPERKTIPKSTRIAWQQLNHIFFRLHFWLRHKEDTYIEITRFQAVRAIRELVAEYPSLEVRPLDCLDRAG